MVWYNLESRWDPFPELDQLRREMDRLWDQTMAPERFRGRPGVYPLVNISEDQDHIFIRAELAGVKAEDIEITLQDNNLLLKGERKIAPEEKVVGYHRREREAGTFRRVVRLPARVDAAKVEAVFKDGILVITLSKPEEIKPKQITVKSA